MFYYISVPHFLSISHAVPFLSSFFVCLFILSSENRHRISPKDRRTHTHTLTRGVPQTVLRLQQILTNHMKRASSPCGLFIKKQEEPLINSALLSLAAYYHCVRGRRGSLRNFTVYHFYGEIFRQNLNLLHNFAYV